jgi:UDP-glucuronate 4-epimerase
MKILVTGAGGFIGSHVLKRLMTLRVDSVGVDNFSNYYSSKYKHIRLKEIGIQKDIQVLNCNLAVFDEIDNLVSKYKPNYIIHLAAQAGVRLSLSQTNLYIDTNVCGFQNLIRSAIENHVDGIIYASSSSVYGDSSSIPYKEDMQILRPKSIYGVTKLSNELFAEIQSKDSKLRFRGLRFFTVYGPWGSRHGIF